MIAHELGHITGGHIIRFGEGRQGRDRHHAPVAAARRRGDGGRRRRGRRGHPGRRPAGGDGQVPRLQPHPGILGRPGRRQLPRQGRDQRQGLARLLQEAAEPGVPPRHPAGRQLRAHPPADRRAHRRARERLSRTIRPGTRRPIPRSRSASSGSRPSSLGYVDDPEADARQTIRRATRASRPAMPALMPGTRAPIPTRPLAEVDSLLADAAATIPISSS